MNNKEKQQLQKMIDDNSVEDNTELIRNLKHSDKILTDIQNILILKKKYSKMEDTLEKQTIFQNECNFLYTNYKYLFEKIYMNQLDLNVLQKMLQILAKIENKELDQHTGSFEVGKLLKTIYIDSVIYEKDNSKNVSWKKYKTMNNL